MGRDLSILIPARNEIFLQRTIEDVLQNMQADTEIIAVCDGNWPDPQVQDHERVTLVYHPNAIGQRAAVNEAARISTARYVMKLDAHCAMGPGFDQILLEDIQDGWTIVPAMQNLHAFDWVCQGCGNRTYQGPTPTRCDQCGGVGFERDILWYAKPSPYTTAMRFDRDLKFQYWGEYKRRQVGDLVDTMSIIGACWMIERGRYHQLEMCDERHGSWGQMGTEVACKTWLSGGRLVVDKNTWFAHLFRTQGGDFGFPYPLSGDETARARAYSHWLWQKDKPDEMPNWKGARHSLRWLIDRFSPVPGWGEENVDEKAPNMQAASSESRSASMDRRGAGGRLSVPGMCDMWPGGMDISTPELQSDGTDRVQRAQVTGAAILYYTDNRLEDRIMVACQNQLRLAGLEIVSVSLEPIAGFGHNIVVSGERGPLTMFRQILAGLEAISAEIVFFAEHDVLYHPSHFEFVPLLSDTFYYNQNVWKVNAQTGQCLFHFSNHTSQLCASRELLLGHYRRRVELVQAGGFSMRMGYEPGTHRRPERVDDYGHKTWMSQHANLDIRHTQNLTKTRWAMEEFRNQRFTRGWTISDHVDPWYGPGEFSKMLQALGGGR